MSGKSKFLLFSRRIVMSIACCCAAVKLLGAIILFDSGQMTCESFKSSGLDDEELDAVDDDFGSNVALPEIFVSLFDGDEDEEDFNVDGFAGTRIMKAKRIKKIFKLILINDSYLMVELSFLVLQWGLAWVVCELVSYHSLAVGESVFSI